MEDNVKMRTQCDVCLSKSLREHIICKYPIKYSQFKSDNFKVTNKEYSSCIETVICESCKLIQPKFLLGYKDIVKFYSELDDKEYLASAKMRGTSNYQQVKKLIERYAVKKESILEIGAGSGTLVKLLTDDYKDSKVTGVEPSKIFCRFAKQEYGLEILPISYEEISVGKYDVIMALDVIEHVVSPDNFVKKIRSLLSDDGIAIIGTPDIGSISSKILKKRWYHIRPPHLYYFRNESFQTLIQKYKLHLVHKGYFYWSLPFYYLVDAVQKLLLRKSIFSLSFLKFNIKINLFDSSIYIVRK